MTLTYRTDGAWGAGKGAVLSAAEFDGNTYEFATRILALETTPSTAISIDHFVIEGTVLTIVLTNGDEHGPFVLPVATWRWTGPWAPTTQYFIGDIFTESGNVYFARVQHVSAATFDPNLATIEGDVYILLLAKENVPYDIGMFYNDLIPSGETIIMLHVAARTFTFPSNFLNSKAYLMIAASDTPITLPIYQNTTVIGFIVFTPGMLTSGLGQFGVLSFLNPGTPVVFVAGDILSISLPYEHDTTASGLSVTLVATTPPV